MMDLSNIQKHTEVIGADGVHVGTVDSVHGDRIKLTKKDAPDGHHHYVDAGLVAGVENGKIRLSASGANAVTLETKH